MALRLPRSAAPLLALVVLAAAGGCQDKAKLAGLERQREALESTTLPKAEFWAQVTRKGDALEARKKSDAEAAALRQEIAALRSQREAAAAAELDQARATRAAAEAERRAAQAELARAEGERAQRQAALHGFDSRRREGAGS